MVTRTEWRLLAASSRIKARAFDAVASFVMSPLTAIVAALSLWWLLYEALCAL